MREIKFRMWDTKRKEWVHGPGNEISLFGETILFGEISRRPDDTNATLEEFVTDFLPLQFTGLLDKNGKEIYEGDILRLNYNYRERDDDDIAIMPITVQIDFQGGSFWFTGDGYTDCNWHFYNASDREVIGNIYETPNLL